MRARNVLTIRNKIILSLLALSVISMSTSGWILYRQARMRLDEDLGNRLVAIAQAAAVQFDGMIVSEWIPSKESRTYESLQGLLSRFQRATGTARIYLFDHEHRSLADTQADVSPGTEYLRLRLDRFELEQVWQGRGIASVQFTGVDGHEYKSGYAPIRSDGQIIAAVGVDMGAGFLDTLRRLRRGFWLLMALVTSTTVLLGFFLARRITQPIHRLVTAARHIGNGELDREISLDSRDELGYLGNTMEEMRQNIVERDAQVKLMLANVAHEIRNPLGGIELFAGLVAEDLPDEHDAQQSLTRIRNEARNLNRIITEFLEFARPQPYQPRTVNIQILFDDLSFLIGQELHRQGINCQIELPRAVLYVDPEQAKRIFLNLFRNAAQAMPDGGKLSVTAEPRGDKLQIRLCDTGTGIAQEDLDRLFDPFFTTKEKGAGLGLPIVKRDVELNGGEIQIESLVGEGTTVTVSLPLAAER